jgi:hypothetical protein
MVVSRPARNGALSVLVSAGTLIAAASQTPPDTAAVLSRAGAYVERFIEEFSSVVAEERYRQELGPAGVVNLRRPQPRVRRELRSDFVILRVGPPVMWRPFRDVWEVDGKPVRDREERLTTLLTSASPSAYEQARSIAQEATRYNIGLQARTVNTPITALQFLETSHQPRVDFTQDSHARIRDQQVTVISYRERARPTIIRGILRDDDVDLPASGRYWIDGAGQVIRAELKLNRGLTRVQVTTEFVPDSRFGIAVPSTMDEQLEFGRYRVVARATYSNLHRFDVQTSATLAAPAAK